MIKWFLTGGALPPLLACCGVFFLVYLRGYPFRAPKRLLGAMRQGETSDGTSPFRAVMLALAGTLGVGNIVGVANALSVGGAGAIFWMWITALVAMILKYAEIVLAVSHRRITPHGFVGGAYYYVRDCFERLKKNRLAKALSLLFALLMLANALSMGCIIQVNAVSSAFRGVLGISPWISGALLILLTLPVLTCGSRSVSRLTEHLVPIMTGGFVILSIAVLILKKEVIGEAVGTILRQAFTPKGATGGILGFLSSRALKSGTMRGLLSNEGGCGTAPTAHAHADTKSPAAQGVWGIFEVFVDTILLCTLTALVILVSPIDPSVYDLDGVMLTVRAFSSVLGEWSAVFFVLAILCFGYATLLCWANYGMESLAFLTERPSARRLYLAAVGVCIGLGCAVSPSGVWELADFCIAALTVLNLLTLLLMRREIKRETLLTFATSPHTDEQKIRQRALRVKKQQKSLQRR